VSLPCQTPQITKGFQVFSRRFRDQLDRPRLFKD
jgi:hypothetical protein